MFAKTGHVVFSKRRVKGKGEKLVLQTEASIVGGYIVKWVKMGF